MAQTYHSGTFNRDDMKGVPESVEAVMADLRATATPFLTMIAPTLNNLQTPIIDTTYSFFERQWRPMRTTLASQLTAGGTTVVLTNPAAKEGSIIAVDEELVRLVTDSGDGLTFTNCDRSVGSGADATHLAGASVLVLGKAHTIGSAAGTADMIVQPDKPTNYTQIIKREVGVSGTVAVMAEYHRAGRSRYDANLEDHMVDAKQELENSLLRGTPQAAVGDATPGMMEGLFERIISGSGSDMAGQTPTRDHVRAALREIKDYGGEALRKILLCSDYMKGVIDDWGLAHQAHPGDSSAAKQFGSDIEAIKLGGEIVPVFAMTKIKTHLYLVTTEFVRVGPLTGPYGSREFTHTYHGNDGDRFKGQLIGEYGAQIKAPKAHKVLYNCAAS